MYVLIQNTKNSCPDALLKVTWNYGWDHLKGIQKHQRESASIWCETYKKGPYAICRQCRYNTRKAPLCNLQTIYFITDLIWFIHLGSGTDKNSSDPSMAIPSRCV